MVSAGQDQQSNVVGADAVAQLPGGLSGPSDVGVGALMRAAAGAAGVMQLHVSVLQSVENISTANAGQRGDLHRFIMTGPTDKRLPSLQRKGLSPRVVEGSRGRLG